MNNAVLALVPFTSGLFYLGVLTLVRRHASASNRWVTCCFALMASWSFTSVVWRLQEGHAFEEPLLRLVEAQGMVFGAAFLLLFQRLYASRWSRRARIIATVSAVAISTMTLSGALNRIIVESDPTAGPFLQALIVPGMASWVASYLLGPVYLVFAYRTQRDPIERNRIKYAAIAEACICVGQFTNLFPVLRQLPLDHGANIVAASILAFSVVRYRLFDVDVALQRGIIRVLASLPVMILIAGLFALAFPGMRTELFTVTGAFELLALGGVVGLLAPFMRTRVERLFDRIFVGGHIEHREAVVAFTRRTLELRDIDAIAREVTELCQWATDSGCVALLLPDRQRSVLGLTRMSGPFQRLRPEWTISTANPILLSLMTNGGAVTPFALTQMLESADVSAAEIAEFEPYRESIATPIVAHGEVVGCLFVAPKVYDAPFTIEDLETLALVAAQAGVVIQSAGLLEQWRERAQTDFLTGLPNHRHLQELLDLALVDHEQREAPFSVAMIDVDNFKMLNDVHGHPAGDDALRMIAACLRESMRPEDIVGRYGGDEFLVIMPGVAQGEGEGLMARATRNVRKLTLVTLRNDEPNGQRLPARISWGIASYPEAGLTARALISAADSGLLQQRFAMRRAGNVHTDRTTVRQMLEQDPEKLRIARALLDIIDAKDPYTSEHSQQIASFALLVSDELALPDAERYALWLGSLLHDVGKVGTPASVLRKPGRLSPEEWDLMRLHPMLGEQMVRGLLDMPEVIGIVGSHHERWDGTGYPRGLKGEDIPRLARVVSVADAFSAMVHDRPYHKGLSWDAAAGELQRGSGTQFEPEAVEAFVRAIAHRELRQAEAA